MGLNNSGQLGDGTYNYACLLEQINTEPPALAIGTYSNQPAVFFATATGTNYTLQMTTNLASGIWVPVTNGIPISGVQIPNASGTAFFRLH